MDPKPEDILTVDLTVDIDPTILLGLEFEKMKFVSQLDVESVLSEGYDKIIETNNTLKDLENQDSLTSDTNSESDSEEPSPGAASERNKDSNGNEETLSDYNLNWLFKELVLSDSDNEEEDEEPSPRLRERGGKQRNISNRNQNRTNYLKSDKYNRSQIDPRNLRFLSGSSFVQSNNASHYFSVENSQSSAFNSNELFFNVPNSEPVSTSYHYEDSRANSIGSPESGYESSLTGSPPPALSSAFINHKLELISPLDDDKFINYIIEDPAVCALTDHPAPKQPVDNRDYKEKINELVEFLKNTPSELVEVTNTVASSNRNTDFVPLAKCFDDTNSFAIDLPPVLKNVGSPQKLGYKLKEDAKKELRRFLSQDKFWATEEKIFKRLIKDKKENRPIKVIYVVDEKDKLSDIRTNLHHAVLKQNIEEIYCLVEIQKIYDLDLSDLNIRDKYGKTALDYAIQQHMHHAVIDYLKENTACQSVIV